MGKTKLQDNDPGEPKPKLFRTISWPRSCPTHPTDPITVDYQLLTAPFSRSLLFTSEMPKMEFREIEKMIMSRSKMRASQKVIYMYPAFRRALLTILRLVKDSQDHLILIHGVPRIGKSTLAECLAYFLGLYAGEGEKSFYLQLLHEGSTVNKDHLTAKVSGTSFFHNFAVVDQVNMNILNDKDMMVSLRDRRIDYRVPVVMFTSGHYAPDHVYWYRKKNVSFKVISMDIDSQIFSALRSEYQPHALDHLSDESLRNLTKFFGHTIACLSDSKYEQRDEDKLQITLDQVRDNLFPVSSINALMNSPSYHIMCLAFKFIISNKILPLEDFLRDDPEMDPRIVQYLGLQLSLSQVKDAHDAGLNAIFNFMFIEGQPDYQEDGYTEFNLDSHVYKFLNKQALYDALMKASNKYTVEDQHKSYWTAYETVPTGNVNNHQYNYLRGGFYELLISSMCQVKTKQHGTPYGLMLEHGDLSGWSLKFNVVSRIADAVEDEKMLCSLPQKTKVCAEQATSFWFVLNSKKPFKGYDFAYMFTTPSKVGEAVCVVEKLVLFQVTMNPRNKGTEQKTNMANVLISVKSELRKLGLVSCAKAADRAVVPVFVHPGDETYEVPLPLPNGHNLKVKAVSFPVGLLKLV